MTANAKVSVRADASVDASVDEVGIAEIAAAGTQELAAKSDHDPMIVLELLSLRSKSPSPRNLKWRLQMGLRKAPRLGTWVRLGISCLA
jgi:hypothetical protein